MRTFPDNFVIENSSLQRKPRIAIKFLDSEGQGIFWAVSHPDIDPDDGLEIFSALVNTTARTQSITPEKGFSTIGKMVIRVQDQGKAFTDKLRELDQEDKALDNRNVEIWFGHEALDFADYGKLFTFIVDKVSNGPLEYEIVLSDKQRFQKKGIFSPKITQFSGVVKNAGSGNEEIVKLTTDMVINGDGVFQFADATNFIRVEHDSGWELNPNETVGYFSIKGVDDRGNNTEEIFSFTGYHASNTSTRVSGVTREVFNTSAIAVNGIDTDEPVNTEVQEYIYVDLPVPKMLIALLTGSLFGQVGQSLPSHWHAGLSASDIDLASFENIGSDLDQIPLSFIGMQEEDAKAFIAKEILRLMNLFIKVNQDGELQLKRFTTVPQQAAPVHVFDESEVIRGSVSQIERNSNQIRNSFLLRWHWRPDTQSFARRNLFVDATSINKYKFVSDVLTLELKGIRNRSRELLNQLQNLAEGIRARYSNPSILVTFKTSLAFAAQYEVGDVIALNLKKWPDFADDDNINSNFEIQSISFNLRSQTAEIRGFGTSGVPDPIDFGRGREVAELDTSNWRNFEDYLAPGTFTSSGGTITITGNNTGGNKIVGAPDLTDETLFYTTNGDNIVIQTGVVVETSLNFVLDCADITLQGTGRFQSTGNGYAGGTADLSDPPRGKGTRGYFGGDDLVGPGVANTLTSFGTVRTRPSEKISPGVSSIEQFNIRVNSIGKLEGLPKNLISSSGSAGTFSIDVVNSNQTYAGGNGGASGGSMIFIADGIFPGTGPNFVTNGGNAQPGNQITLNYNSFISGYNVITTTGDGAPGYPSPVVALIKNRATELPVLALAMDAKTGNVSTPSVDKVAGKDSFWRYSTQQIVSPTGAIRPLAPGNKYGGLIPATVLEGRNKQHRESLALVKFLTADEIAVESPGVDKIPPAPLPALQLSEQINTPRTPNGNISTVTVTAISPGGSYAYAIFEYRAIGQEAWYPLEYKIQNETTKELPSDGSEYEFSARSVNINGLVSTGRVIETIKLTRVTKDVEDSDTSNPDVQVPRVRGLRLDNSVDDDTNWDKWKGPAPEFSWRKMSVTSAGNIVTPNGAIDLHLKGYLVQLFRISDGILLREFFTEESKYVYSLDDNRKDNREQDGPEAFPVRSGLKCRVIAVAATGYQSEATEIVVSNPAPAAVTGIEAVYTQQAVELSFTPPNDLDFVGVKIRGRLYTGSSIVIDPAAVRSELLDIVSVDQFGEGATANFTLINDAPGAPTNVQTEQGFTSIEVSYDAPEDFDYLGVNVRWRVDGETFNAKRLITSTSFTLDGLIVGADYEIELTSVDTIGEGNSVSVVRTTRNIDSSELPDIIEKSLTLDEEDGRLITNNSGFIGVWGVTLRPSLSPNPLIMHDWDSVAEESTFWFDVAGNFALGRGGYTYDIATTTHTFGDFASGKYMLFDGDDLEFGPNTQLGNNSDRSFTVGATGDFATINEALEVLGRQLVAYKKGGVSATLTIQSGTVLNEALDLQNIDLSWVAIESVDPVVDLNPDGTGASAFVYAENAKAPIIKFGVKVVGSVGLGKIFISDKSSSIFVEGDVTYDVGTKGTGLCQAGNNAIITFTDEVEYKGGISAGSNIIADSGGKILFEKELTLNECSFSFAHVVSGTGGEVIINSRLTAIDCLTATTSPSGLIYLANAGKFHAVEVVTSAPNGDRPNRILTTAGGSEAYIGGGSCQDWVNNGVVCTRSRVVVNGDFRRHNNLGNITADDLVVQLGGIIQATGAQGGTTRSNRISSNGLVIRAV